MPDFVALQQTALQRFDAHLGLQILALRRDGFRMRHAWRRRLVHRGGGFSKDNACVVVCAGR